MGRELRLCSVVKETTDTHLTWQVGFNSSSLVQSRVSRLFLLSMISALAETGIGNVLIGVWILLVRFSRELF